LASSLPVLRRVLAAGAIPRAPLPEVFRRRETLRRKHFLRTLAVEAGFSGWEEYRPALALMKPSEVERIALLQRDPSQLNHWFANLAAANAFASAQGGNVVRMGRQAVVVRAHLEATERSHA
jgi:hypothetical protein